MGAYARRVQGEHDPRPADAADHRRRGCREWEWEFFGHFDAHAARDRFGDGPRVESDRARRREVTGSGQGAQSATKTGAKAYTDWRKVHQGRAWSLEEMSIDLGGVKCRPGNFRDETRNQLLTSVSGPQSSIPNSINAGRPILVSRASFSWHLRLVFGPFRLTLVFLSYHRYMTIIQPTGLHRPLSSVQRKSMGYCNSRDPLAQDFILSRENSQTRSTQERQLLWSTQHWREVEARRRRG